MPWLTRVRSDSMAPTLHDGQLVLTFRLRARSRIGRGDLVVADAPGLGLPVVKRVVGLPGEAISIRAGQVRVDDRPLEEPYASPSAFTGDYRVPAGHYVLLGDNRDASTDSRSWPQPFVDRAAIRGRLLAWGSVRGRARGRRTPSATGRLTPRPPRPGPCRRAGRATPRGA